MLDVATVIVYSGGYIFLVFLSVCLGNFSAAVLAQDSLVYLFDWCSRLLAATGLYYLAELVEEYTKLAKKFITYTTQGVLVLHVLVLVIDRLPLKCVAAGVAAHLCYLGQLQRYPFMQLLSPVTAGSIGACLCCTLLSIAAGCCWLYLACFEAKTFNMYMQASSFSAMYSGGFTSGETHGIVWSTSSVSCS